MQPKISLQPIRAARILQHLKMPSGHHGGLSDPDASLRVQTALRFRTSSKSSSAATRWTGFRGKSTPLQQSQSTRSGAGGGTPVLRPQRE